MLKWVSTVVRCQSTWRTTSTKQTTLNKTKAITVSAVHMLTSKSKSINTVMCLLTALCIISALVPATNGFKAVEVNNGEGRKLFGGYRITPKHCRATKTLAINDPRKNGPTICMFNHECAQRNGEVVGACMDGFLFGACCQIPDELDLESTLLNDAQNSYYQQHQQQKLQDEHGGINQAVAQSYETYGESQQQQQQQSQENKYATPTSKPNPKPQRVQKPQQQQQQKYKPELPKPIYGNDLEGARPADSYTQTSINKLYQQLESGSSSTLVNSYPGQQDAVPHNKYQEAHESANRPAVGPTASYEVSVDETSTLSDSSAPQSSSVELEKDTQLQLESQARPVKVPFTTSSQALNDDFVLGLLSTEQPQAAESEPTSMITTGLPMRIVNGLTEPNSSSESASFEELSVTHNPVKTNVEGSKSPQKQTPQTARPKPKPRPQKPRPRPQAQTAKPQSQQQPAKTQSVKQSQKQKPKPKPQQQQQQSTNSQNHLMLDGGEFTHSDITHPGAEADLIEDDLQFSTGYGPQPVFMEAPVRQPSPISYNPATSSSTAGSANVASADKTAEQAGKRPTTYVEPTTGTSITTHVDSIESIILQLNGTTHHGPTYNIVSQQAPQTAAYGADMEGAGNRYESTSSASHGDATTNYYDAVEETKRPNDYYGAAGQSNEPGTSAYLASVTTDLNASSYHKHGSTTQQQPSHSYVSKPTDATDIASSPTAQSYGDDASIVLDEHTMPANNYNDELQSASHSTHEFNKMPAVGIAYPVDLANMEEDESSVVSSHYGQRPQHTAATVDKIAEDIADEGSSGQVPIITGKPQRPATTHGQSYSGLQLPSLIHYDAVPQEVSVSSHTTKVEDDESSSASYQTPKPVSLTTSQKYEDSSFSQRPFVSKTTTTAYLTRATTLAPARPQFNTATTDTPTARPISGIITLSGTRPRPKPRPKPSTTRPNDKNSKPSTAKRPITTKPAQPALNYGGTQILIKKPAPQQTQAQKLSSNNNKRPAQRPTNIYADNTPAEDNKKPAQLSSTQTNTEKQTVKQPSKQSTKQPVKQPAASYQHNKPGVVKRPTPQQQPSSSHNAESTTHVLNAEAVYQRPEQAPTYYAEEPATTYTPMHYISEIEDAYQEAVAEYDASHIQDSHISADLYDQQDTKVTTADYAQDYDKPDATYDQHIKAPQPTFDPEAYYPAPKPSLNYNAEEQSEPTNRPIAIHKPSIENPAPTPARPSTTVIYHDSEVPPLVMAADKLDAFAQSTAQAEAGLPPSNNYQGQVETLAAIKPQYAERPQYTYVHKKPGFVRVTSKPITTTDGIATPKPALFTLVTNSGWSQRPGSISAIYNDNAYPPTTPLPLAGLGSTSYIYNPVVTRRPDIMLNTPEYASLSGVTSNDFDDPGYYGAQNVPQNVHPAFTQSVADAEYGIPSDDRPAFPGYYGPTPTYPPFPIPGEKVGAPVEEETYTSPNDFVNFPPVRNPNLNMSAASSAVTTDLELSTPAFVEDGVLKDKMNTLVHKLVESLQGNFDALADMIDDVNNTAAGAPANTYQSGAIGAGAAGTTRKPTRKPTRTSASAKPATTKRPATRATTKQPTRRTSASTQRPVTRRPTTTTRKPSSRKPSRRVTTTTTKPQPTSEDELIDEEDEEDVNPSDNEINGAQDEAVPGSGGRQFKCGVRPHIKSGRIVGGKGSTFGAFPWQVLVRESTWLGLFTKNKCGGVLITNRYVITAAHCQPGFLASLVAVMGEFDISGDLESKRSVTKNVKRVIVHRQYDPATFENDLALLELDSQVQFDTHIVPICMPNDHADFTGRMATVTGWGRLKYGGGVPSVLQEVQVPIIENSVCQEMFQTAGHNKKILGSFLCAGYANGQKDSCEGDSGGPLVLQRPDGRYELAGTVSHGIKCAAPYLPGVYMRTTFYKPWLRSITGVK